MNSLIENKFFRTLPIIYEFLSLPQEDWNNKRNGVYNKIQSSKSFKTMHNLEGEIKIEITKQSDDIAMTIKDDINGKNEAFEKLNKEMDELIEVLEKASQCFKNVSNCFFELQNKHKVNESLSKMFGKLFALFKIWSSDYLKQNDFLKDEIKYFFKFINKENMSFHKKFDEFKSARDEYKKSFDKLKKNQQATQKDKDAVISLKQYYGFQLYYLRDEYKKLGERQAQRMDNQFIKYNKNRSIILQDFRNCCKLINFGNVNIGEGGDVNDGMSSGSGGIYGGGGNNDGNGDNNKGIEEVGYSNSNDIYGNTGQQEGQ